MTKRLCGTLAVVALLGATVFGQDSPPPIDAIFKDFTDHSPGCAVGVARGGAPIAAKAFGMADLEHGVSLTPQSVFYMASVSKQFAALSILLLERDGKLHLEDRVRIHVPELPDYADAITTIQDMSFCRSSSIAWRDARSMSSHGSGSSRRSTCEARGFSMTMRH